MNGKKAYTVVVVDDEPILLKNIINKIENTSRDFIVVADTYNGADAIEIIDNFKPDILFTDIRMPIMDGLELIKRVIVRYPDMCIVILSGYSEFSYAQQAIKYGIEDYLLKPLKTEVLAETLQKLRLKLNRNAYNTEKDLLARKKDGEVLDAPLPEFMSGACYIPFLVCVGNLNNAIVPNIDWDSSMREISGAATKGWIFNEKAPNIKLLVLPAESVEDACMEDVGNKLKDYLIKLSGPYSVTVCTGKTSVRFSELTSRVHKLRDTLDKGLIMGYSALLTAEDGKSFLSADLITPVLENSLIRLVQNGKIGRVQKEVMDIFEQWYTNKFPQIVIEKNLLKLAALFQKHVVTNSNLAFDAETKISNILAGSIGFRDTYNAIWQIFENILLSDRNITDSAAVLADNIESYIRGNFSKPLSLEGIARKFNFNPSYLTKIFKHYKGDTPVKYLTTLRMDEAKRLMVRQHHLDIKDICEIVGYTDQHYFSRVFKNVTGISPTEYREQAYRHETFL